MTVNQLLKCFDIGHRQVVHITDNTRHVTYESDQGTYCFEDYDDLFDNDYKKCINYILRMRVLCFTANDDMIWIRATSNPT